MLLGTFVYRLQYGLPTDDIERQLTELPPYLVGPFYKKERGINTLYYFKGKDGQMYVTFWKDLAAATRT